MTGEVQSHVLGEAQLLVLKTGELARLREFYSALGIVFVEEKHGNGPTHFAGRVGDLVLELYPLPAVATGSAGTVRALLALEALIPKRFGTGDRAGSAVHWRTWTSQAPLRRPA
jgi:hypothetical protein